MARAGKVSDLPLRKTALLLPANHSQRHGCKYQHEEDEHSNCQELASRIKRRDFVEQFSGAAIEKVDEGRPQPPASPEEAQANHDYEDNGDETFGFGAEQDSNGVSTIQLTGRNEVEAGNKESCPARPG